MLVNDDLRVTGLGATYFYGGVLISCKVRPDSCSTLPYMHRQINDAALYSPHKTVYVVAGDFSLSLVTKCTRVNRIYIHKPTNAIHAVVSKKSKRKPTVIATNY